MKIISKDEIEVSRRYHSEMRDALAGLDKENALATLVKDKVDRDAQRALAFYHARNLGIKIYTKTGDGILYIGLKKDSKAKNKRN